MTLGALHRRRVWVLILSMPLLGIPFISASGSEPTPLKWGPKRSDAIHSTAQQSGTAMQPLASPQATTNSQPAPVTVLRWRSSDISRTSAPSGHPIQPERIVTVRDANAPVAQVRRQVVQNASKYPVRQASAHDLDLPAAIPDAFDDPFEDGANRPAIAEPQMVEHAAAPMPIEPALQRQAVQLVAQEEVYNAAWQDDPPPVPQAEMPVDPQPNLPPQSFSAPQALPEQGGVPELESAPGTGSVPNLDDVPGLDEPPAVPELPEPGRYADPPSLADSDSDNDKAACGQVYNRRDCCEDGEYCADARDRWQRDAISKISLDITPNMHPEEDDPVEQERQRDRDLAGSPSRVWRDRQGQILAEGRLTNIKRGRALILDADNQIVPVLFNDLCDDDLCFLTAWWRVPTECTFSNEQHAGRNWAPMTLTWKASALCHKPLRFEEVQLERYGHTAGPVVQPVLSGAHFFTNLITIPYQAGIHPSWECQYALGYYRPGSCAPWMVPPVPLSLRGALFEAGAVVGGVAFFP